MKTTKRTITVFTTLMLTSSVFFAQKTVKEYVDETSREKIKKSINMTSVPQTAGSYGDGHGTTPLLTSESQLPDTIALVTFHIYDMGTSNTIKGVSTTYYSLSEKGGNTMANKIFDASIAQLKEAFKKQGVVLLTPDEFLNTKQKKDYYYNTFAPKISKLGSFLSNIETKQVDVSAGADGYRTFDIAGSADFLRAESLGSDLAKNLGVDAVLSVSAELMSEKKDINMNGLKMVIHGKNPIPKEDKRYISQNMGAGYYEGQIYAGGNFYFRKPIEVGRYEKGKQSINDNLTGVEIIFECMVERFYEEMKESIAKAAKKYKK